MQVADGVLIGVPEAVWKFEVSGMDVIPKWLGYRMAKPAGRAASSDSPLDHIRPTTWSTEWSTELVEIVAAIKETLALVPDGIALLDEIIAGPLIAADELPPVPDALRQPPKPGKAAAGQDEFVFDDGMLPGTQGDGALLMTFKPNLSVKEGLDHLAKRLDPIIGDRLAANLGGHPWTVVLEILDQKKGFTSGYKYWTYDLQAQLRMLTERFGDFGYPFDDHHRTVSTIGNELRIVRKQMAHMHEFTVDEAFRANDFAVRLLEHFGDSEGLDEAKRIRHEALAALAAQEGVTEQVAAAGRRTVTVDVDRRRTTRDPG